MRIPIEFAKNSYKHNSLPVSGQRLLNWYVEGQPPDAKTPLVLLPTPGLELFGTLGAGPIRGMDVMGGVLYVVSATTLYSVNSSGTETSIGTIAGTGNVSMANNGTQLVIVNGIGGRLYTVAGGLVDISDADFVDTANSVAFIDQFFVFNKNDGSGQFFISSALDGTAYAATDFATAESSPDELISVLADHRELWLFGDLSVEVWANTGGSFPFTRQHALEIGCASRFSPAKIANNVVWLGDDGIAYAAIAYEPNRVSTHAIEQAWKGYATINDAISYTYKDEGHYFWVLSFPTAGATWVYDFITGLWHERSFFSGGSHTRHRSNAYARAYKSHIVGDYSNGKLYKLKTNVYEDDSGTIQRVAITPPIHKDRQTIFMGLLEIDFEGGVALASGQGSDPQAMLDWSDDGGHTFTGDITASIDTSIGAVGEYKQRAMWHILGSFRERTFRLKVSDPVKWIVLGAVADVELSDG